MMEIIKKDDPPSKSKGQCRRIKLTLTREGLEMLKQLDKIMDVIQDTSFFTLDGSKRIAYLYFFDRVYKEIFPKELKEHLLDMDSFTDEEVKPYALEVEMHSERYHPSEVPRKKLKIDYTEQKQFDSKLTSLNKIQAKAKVAWLELTKKDQDKLVKHSEKLASGNADETLTCKYLQLYNLFHSRQAKLESYYQFSQDVRKTLHKFGKKDEILFESDIPTKNVPDYLNEILRFNEKETQLKTQEIVRLENEIVCNQEYETELTEDLRKVLKKFGITEETFSNLDAKGLIALLEEMSDKIKKQKEEIRLDLEKNEDLHQKLREELIKEFIMVLKQQNFSNSILFGDDIDKDLNDQFEWDKVLIPLNSSWINLHQEIRKLQDDLENTRRQNNTLTQDINDVLNQAQMCTDMIQGEKKRNAEFQASIKSKLMDIPELTRLQVDSQEDYSSWSQSLLKNTLEVLKDSKEKIGKLQKDLEANKNIQVLIKSNLDAMSPQSFSYDRFWSQLKLIIEHLNNHCLLLLETDKEEEEEEKEINKKIKHASYILIPILDKSYTLMIFEKNGNNVNRYIVSPFTLSDTERESAEKVAFETLKKQDSAIKAPFTKTKSLFCRLCQPLNNLDKKLTSTMYITEQIYNFVLDPKSCLEQARVSRLRDSFHQNDFDLARFKTHYLATKILLNQTTNTTVLSTKCVFAM